MIIFLVEVIAYTYFDAENCQPCERQVANTRHRENVDKIPCFKVCDCETPVSRSSKILLKKIVFTVALSSVDKHKKYRRFDKSMIYLSQSLARQSVFSSFLCHVCI